MRRAEKSSHVRWYQVIARSAICLVSATFVADSNVVNAQPTFHQPSMFPVNNFSGTGPDAGLNGSGIPFQTSGNQNFYPASGHLPAAGFPLTTGYPFFVPGATFPISGGYPLVPGYAGWGPPLVAPPVYVRNRDGAVYIPPTLGNYGLWYDSLYGCVGPLPTYGFASPVWPGFGIVPSAMSFSAGYWNPGYTPFHFRSSASYSVVSPGSMRWSEMAIAPTQLPIFPDDGHGLPPGMKVTPVPEIPFDHEPQLPDDGGLPELPAGEPLLNEFPPLPREERVTTAAERLQSLRHQSSGDDSFRRRDYSSAEVFYGTAISSAPDRRAPWIRMAMLKIARSEFDMAARHLKTGLLLPAEKTRGWMQGTELLGANAADELTAQSVPLWDWVTASPLSSDRLLLAGAFQRFRGFDATGNELLAMAGHDGEELACVQALQSMIADAISESRPISTVDDLIRRQDNNKSSVSLTADEQPLPSRKAPPTKSAAASGGIYMRGSGTSRKSSTYVPATTSPLGDASSADEENSRSEKIPDAPPPPSPGPVPLVIPPIDIPSP